MEVHPLMPVKYQKSFWREEHNGVALRGKKVFHIMTEHFVSETQLQIFASWLRFSSSLTNHEIIANLALYAYSMIFQALYITIEEFWKDASDQGHLDIQKVKQILLGGKECHSSGGVRWDLEVWKL